MKPQATPNIEATPRPDWRWVYFAILAATLVSHLPELAGWVTCNPIYSDRGLLAEDPRHLLPGGCTMDGNDGVTLQALGGRAAEMWLEGRLPWWNSDAGLGLPLAAEGQPGAFFLPFVLLLHFVSGTVWLKLIMQVLTGSASVALLREIGLTRAAAAVGGILMALCGSFAWFAHSHATLPIAFLPGLLFGLERCRVRAAAGQAGGPLWVALALAYSLVAGFPETAFMDGLLAAVWALTAACRLPRHRLGALVVKIAAGGLTGLALAAPAWLSFVDYLGISSVGLHDLVSGNHMQAAQAATILLPSLYGPPYADLNALAWSQDGGFFGPSLALLALIALRGGAKHAGLRWAMAGWILFWLSVFFGFPPSHAVWAALPPLNEVQITRYAMPSLECAAAVLAALAVDDWQRADLRPAGRLALLAFALLAAASLAAAVPRIPPAANFLPSLYLWLSVLEALLVAAALFGLLRGPASRRRALALAAVILLDASLHFTVPELAGMRPEKLALQPVRFLRAHAGLSRVYALSEQLPANAGSWLGVASIQADAVPYAQRWDEAATAIGGDINLSRTGWLVITPAAQLASFRAASLRLRQAGVGYVMTSAAADPFAIAPEPGMSLVYQDRRTRIYGLSDVAPYFATASGGPCRLLVDSRERVRSDCAAAAQLIRRELYLPGWRAEVNGGKAPVHPPAGGAAGAIDGFMQTVQLPAGRADVRFRYAPPHAGLIAWLFGLGLAATLTMAGLPNLSAARRKPARAAAGTIPPPRSR